MQRNYIAAMIGGLTVLSVVLGGAMMGLGTVDAGPQSTQNQSITVTATGQTETTPDRTVIRIAVSSSAKNASAVRSKLATGTKTLRERLDELDVEYHTEEFSIHNDENEYPTYRGRHSFVVTVTDSETVGNVIEAAADAGAEIQDLRMTLSEQKRTQLRKKAIDRAMQDARTQAERIASTSGLSVSHALRVKKIQRDYEPITYSGAAITGKGGAQTRVSTGSVSVSYSLKVTFNATAASQSQ